MTAMLLCNISMAQVQPPATAANHLCGPLRNALGPFDWRTADPFLKRDAETNHFTPEIVALRGVNVGGDLDYILRVFPNHHRALMAMVRLGQVERTARPRGAKYRVECYFDRAVRFVPNDPLTRVLYGVYLAKQNRTEEARLNLEMAERHGADDPQITYNIGLGYVELEDYDRAIAFAKRARELGIELPGLRRRIERAGRWPD